MKIFFATMPTAEISVRENMEDGLNAFPFREDVNARARKRERAEDLVIMVGGVAWRRVAWEDFLGWIFFVF